MTTTEKRANAVERIRINAEIIEFLSKTIDCDDISPDGVQHILRLVSADVWAAYAEYDGVRP